MFQKLEIICKLSNYVFNLNIFNIIKIKIDLYQEFIPEPTFNY